MLVEANGTQLGKSKFWMIQVNSKKMIFAVLYLFLSLLLQYGIHAQDFVPPSKPNYAELEKIPSSTLSKNADFQNACKEMAGYYKDPTKNPALNKVIVMAGLNFGYLDFLYNFKCFMDRLGIKFLPIALDNQIYNYFKATKVHSLLILQVFI